MSNPASLAAVLLACAFSCAGQETREPLAFFRERMGLSDDQIAAIARGKTVATVLPSAAPAEVVVFGAVYVKARPEEFLKHTLDIERLRKLPGYLDVGAFHDPPRLSDLEGFTLEADDIRSLKGCRPGKCGVQLPAEAIQQLQAGIDWSAPNLAAVVNDRVRRMALDLVVRYQKNGNRVLGSYHDSDRPFDVDAQLQSLLGRSEALPVYLPELKRYLLSYPNTKMTNIESLFYWERVNFGMKTTLRLNHAIAWRSDGPSRARVVVVKQLFANHYFQLALDLTACVQETGHSDDTGFYLISVRGSTQQGLTGLLGALLRRIVVSRTRTAQENALVILKHALESKP